MTYKEALEMAKSFKGLDDISIATILLDLAYKERKEGIEAFSRNLRKPIEAEKGKL